MTPASSTQPPASDTEFYRETLHALIQMGTDLARQIHAQATAQATVQATQPTTTTPLPDHAIAFDRIARAVRRTILLARHVATPPPVCTAPTPAQSRTAARTQVLRDVEDAIHGEAANPPEAQSLRRELLERLESESFENDLATRPVASIIKDIRRDLGLDIPLGRPWKRRTPQDIAALHARAAAPSFIPAPSIIPAPSFIPAITQPRPAAHPPPPLRPG